MAYDIGPVIGIEGEKEFRDSIKNINENMKTLGTEMKVVASQFDKNDNSTEALTGKNKVLNKQIEEQKNKISELEKGLKAAAEKYDENDKVTQGWQRSVNLATAELNNMERELKNNTETMNKAKDPTEDMTKKIKNFGDNADKAKDHTLKLGDIIKANLISDAIIGGVKALGSAMVGLAKGIGDTVQKSVDYASDIKDMSQRTGETTTEFQKYSYAAKMSGMETETLQRSMERSQKSFASAKTGSKTLQSAYKELGVDISKISSPGGAFDASIKALANIKDENERNALANQIFGKSYADLAPLLAEGAGGIDKLKQKASDLGLVMSEGAVDAGENLGDTLDTLKLTTGGLANSLISLLLPGLSSIAGAGVSYISKFSNEIQSTEGDMNAIGDIVGTTLSNIVSKIAEKLPAIADGAKSLITSFMSGISNNLPQIIQTGITIVMDLVQGALQALPSILDAGIKAVISLADGVTQALPKLIPVAIDAILKLCDTLINNLPKIIDSALKIILTLADGLIKALPKLAEKIPTIIVKIVNTIADNLPKIINAGVTIITKLTSGLVKAIPSLISHLPELISAIIKALTSVNWLSVGVQIVAGIAKGLWDGITHIDYKGLGKSLLNSFKNALGIHSPSKLFQDEVGENLALGLGLGFTDQMQKVTNDMTNAIPTNFDAKLNLSSTNSIKPATGFAEINSKSNQGNMILQLMLPNGKVLAEYIAPFNDILQGKNLVLAERSLGL